MAVSFGRCAREIRAHGLGPGALPGIVIVLLCESVGLICGLAADAAVRAYRRRQAEQEDTDGKMFINGQWVSVFPDD